jgi:hypothetical protein
MKSELQVNKQQLENINHGLQLLHDKLVNNIHSLKPSDPDAPNLKEYYSAKRQEILSQMKTYEALLQN